MPSTISAGTTAGTALNFTSDTTGNLAFQTNGTTTALSIDTNQNVTFANNVTYTGNIQGATITATAGFSGNGASLTGTATSLTAGAARNITNSGGWSVTPSGTKLFFNYNGANVASLDSSGNLICLANITAYGTP
jgi:hypothetical protein